MGQHGGEAREARMGHRLGREDLQRVGARAPRGEGLGRREHAGHRAHAAFAGAAHDRRIEMRRHDQRGAGVADGVDLGDVEHGARADPGVGGRQRHEGGDRRDRAGAVQRHLEGAEAGVEEHAGDVRRPFGLQAAQDGHERQRGRPGAAWRVGSIMREAPRRPAHARRPAGSAARRGTRGVGRGDGRRRRAARPARARR